MKLSIVIPCLNEEKRLPPTLEDYLRFFSAVYKKDFEIVIALNACTDNTPKIVEQFKKKYKQVRSVDVPLIGKGNAVIAGLNSAKGDIIGFVDSDNATRPAEFYKLIQTLGNYDCVVASRWIKGSKVNIKQSFIRRIASRGFNTLVRLFFGLRIRDTQCGAKLFKKQAIKSILPRLGITNWGFDIDILYHLKRAGYKIREIPINWYDDPHSKLKIGKTSYQMFLSITRLRLIYSPFRFIVRFYDLIHDSLVKKRKTS